MADAMGHPLDIDMEQVVAGNMRLAHRPSVLQDLEAGRPMEIDALYTVPLDMARLAGVPTPTLDLLAAMIRLRARRGCPRRRDALPQNAIQANRNSVLLSPALRPKPS